MNIYFECKTNHQIPYINIMTIISPEGNEIVIDRDTTEFSFDENNNKMKMEWINPYIWDGEKPDYRIPDNVFKKGCFVKEIEIEDDAPEGYECHIDKVYVDGLLIPFLQQRKDKN